MSITNIWPILLFLNVQLKFSGSELSRPNDLYQSSLDPKALNRDIIEISYLSDKKIRKRALSEDEIFKQLEFELNADNTERTQSDSEEKLESDKIFKELINETSAPKTQKTTDKDSETIQLITDTIAKLVFRGRQNSGDNSNILGTLSTLFNLRQRLSG